MDPLLRYSRAARAAYWTNDDALRPQLMPELAALGLTLLGSRDDDGAGGHVYAARDADTLVIGYQGTADISGWLADARAVPTFFTGRRLRTTCAYVHRGFLSAYLSTRLWVDAIIVANGGVRQIVYTGHSLGGAEATLGACDSASPIPVSAYTYGSPRVGMADFCNAYGDAGILTTRVVHDQDLVPRVLAPPYQHVTGPLRLRDDGSVVGPVKTWIGAILGWDRALVADIDLESLRDHRVDRYVAACTAHANLTAAA